MIRVDIRCGDKIYIGDTRGWNLGVGTEAVKTRLVGKRRAEKKYSKAGALEEEGLGRDIG